MEPRDIQRLLKASGYYGGGIDGDFGPKSLEAVRKVLERNKPEALKWAAKRQRVAAAQIILTAAGYEPGNIDGYWLRGGTTHEAFNAWDHYVTTGKAEVLPGRSAEEVAGPTPALGSRKWPSQKGVPAFFGEAGSPRATAGKALLPFPFRIAWNKSQKVSSFACHELVADAFTSIWGQTASHYGEREMVRLGLDLFGGCYNNRAMRGGSAKSMHAYGIAYDGDPERNQLRWGRDRAEFAKPAYDPFWAIVEAHGGLSLGRARNYDWMHFQFATL